MVSSQVPDPRRQLGIALEAHRGALALQRKFCTLDVHGRFPRGGCDISEDFGVRDLVILTLNDGALRDDGGLAHPFEVITRFHTHPTADSS